MNPKTLHDKWLEMDAQPQRVNAVDNAYDNASLTIPRLFLRNHANPTFNGDALVDLYSSKMASLIVQRAGKLTNAIFPPNGVPFFSFNLDAGRIAKLVQDQNITLQFPEGVEDHESHIRDILSEIENYLLSKLQASNFRDILNMSMQHVQVTGDPVIHMNDDYEFRLYHLAGVIIRRNKEGIVSEVFLQEWVATDLLPEELASINNGKPRDSTGNHEPYYRYMTLQKDGKWKVKSEFRGAEVEKDTEYKVFPYFHIGWNTVSGEDYSRTPVEEHYGTIRSLEMCHRAMAQGAAASSEFRFGLDPTGFTRLEDIQDTENGSVISARQQDVWSLTLDIGRSLGYIQAYIQNLELSLDRAWGASAAHSLTGERVTATQITQASQEVAEVDGAVLTHVAKSVQEGVVRRAIAIETKKKNLDPLFVALWNEKAITIDIKTGLDALGRQIDAARIQHIMGVLAQTQDPEFHEEFNKSELAREFVRTSGLDISMLLHSQDEKAARAQQRQQAATQQAATQQAIQTAGNVVENQAKQ